MKEKESIDLLEIENEIRNTGIKYIAGVDEAGRGPLAGDVFAAAVIFPEGVTIDGVNDSKKLSEKKRDQLFDIIKEKALAYCIARASVDEIEEINILNAAMLAMKRAVEGLDITPEYVIVDGNKTPDVEMPVNCIIKGDSLSLSIAAASILAKVARDRYMNDLDIIYPEYSFSKHKGYGTKLHYQALDEHGISPVHRMSFLKKYLEKKNED